MSVAHYFQMLEVKPFCFEFLHSHVTPGNALDILKAAALYENEAKFEEVAKMDDFKNLSKENFIARISDFDSITANATSIYQAIISWTRHD